MNKVRHVITGLAIASISIGMYFYMLASGRKDWNWLDEIYHDSEIEDNYGK